jgi:DNA-directed RNA polymerase
MRYYSTIVNKSKTMSTQKSDNKQNLFENNYRLIVDILSENNNIGSEELQKRIEITLLNQETLFVNKINSNIWSFNKNTTELINNVRNKLCKHLSYPIDKLSINTNNTNTKFIPFVRLIILELGVEKVVDILLAYFLEIISKETITLEENETPGISSITAFERFGRKILDKFIYNRYIKSDIYINGGTLSEYKIIFRKEFDYIYEDEMSISIIGGHFVHTLVRIDLLLEIIDKHPETRGLTVQYIRIVQSVRKIFMKNNCRVYYIPQKLPMVCEPKDYVYPDKLGGYLLNDIYYTNELIKSRIGYEKQTTLRDDNLIINMVNGLNKIPYKVNIDVLEFIYAYGIEKNIIIDDTTDEILSFMKNPYKNGLRTKKENDKYRSLVSKVLLQRNILSIADTYSKVEKIYFPVRLDFRTRINCQTDYFDYQKCDLAKGLISFANPGIINKFDEEVIKYFKAYGANMYGENLDKKSLNYRVKWVDENSDYILNFEINNIINKAENKVCFIAFCFEYKRFMEFMRDIDNTKFYTYLPIRLDATCNGYQHLALLTQETKLLSKLNLDMSTHDDDPNDYYTYVSNMNKDYMRSGIEKLSKEIKENSLKIKILNENINKDSILSNINILISKVDNKIQSLNERIEQLEKYINELTINNNLNILRLDKTKFVDIPIKNKTKDLSKFLIEIKKQMKELENKDIINIMKKRVKQINEYNSLIKLDKINLGRPIVKKVVMRQSYSAGLPKLVDNILSDKSIIELEKKNGHIYYKHMNSDLTFSRYDIAIYVKSIIELTRILAPKIDALSKYLNNIVGICTRLGMGVPWNTPSGADIWESYLIENERKIAAFTFTKTRYTFKTYLLNKYDVKKQRKATRPNLIHSLDASTIAILYSYLNKDLCTIHDCFAVTANNVPLLIYKLKMVYIRLYSTNTYLLDFDYSVRFNINKERGDKVFRIEDNYINMPDTNKCEVFPDVNKILTIYNGENNINNLRNSSYLII